MSLDNMVKQTSAWLKGKGSLSDIVISSRLRLARNLKDIPFTHWASDGVKEAVIEKTLKACKKIPALKDAMLFRMDELDKLDRQFLVERHLMSREFGLDPGQKFLVISKDEVVSIMINEEDHVRMQVMQSAFDLDSTWDKIGEFDNILSKELSFSYNDSFGYLTACPTNVGTGLRASVMLHLPALVLTKQIDKILQAIGKLSLTARGLYGEGTEASGNFFQISNQVTLGRTEEELIEHLGGMILQIVEHERNARKVLLENSRGKLEDKVWRAFGILKNSRIITSSETIDLLSSVRLGCDLGILPGVDRKQLNELFIVTQPAHLQKLEGAKLSPQKRDLQRAELIRAKLKIERAK